MSKQSIQAFLEDVSEAEEVLVTLESSVCGAEARVAQSEQRIEMLKQGLLAFGVTDPAR